MYLVNYCFKTLYNLFISRKGNFSSLKIIKYDNTQHLNQKEILEKKNYDQLFYKSWKSTLIFLGIFWQLTQHNFII